MFNVNDDNVSTTISDTPGSHTPAVDTIQTLLSAHSETQCLDAEQCSLEAFFCRCLVCCRQHKNKSIKAE